jgi:Aldo/keto reductase family
MIMDKSRFFKQAQKTTIPNNAFTCTISNFTIIHKGRGVFRSKNRSDYQRDLEPICRENGLGVICYFSLAIGFLSGKYRSEADMLKSARREMVKKYLSERGFRILDSFEKVAQQFNATPAMVALACLIFLASSSMFGYKHGPVKGDDMDEKIKIIVVEEGDLYRSPIENF